MKSYSEELMWEIIDGTATPDQITDHQHLMQNDIAYKTTFLEFLSIDTQLKSMESEEPSMRFTQNVLDQIITIQKVKVKPDPVLRACVAILIVIGVLILGKALFFSSNIEMPNTTSIDFIQNASSSVSWLDITKNPIFLIVLLCINGGLIILLLDRWIAKKVNA
jgi:fumarate reductase subunit C